MNSLQGLPKELQLLGNYASELVVMRDPVFSSMADDAGHFNGTLPADSAGEYGLAEALLEGPDGNSPNVQLLTEEPEELPIAIEDTYTLTDMGTLEGNFLLKKVVSGKALGTFFVAPNKAETIDLTKIYDLVGKLLLLSTTASSTSLLITKTFRLPILVEVGFSQLIESILLSLVSALLLALALSTC